MSKDHLGPEKVAQIIVDYLYAVKKAKGHLAFEQTDMWYRAGWFYLRPPGLDKKAYAIPYRPNQVEAMTREILNGPKV